MKKQYMKPGINVFKVKAESLMTQSGQSSDTSMGFGETLISETHGDSRDDNSIWDDDEE